MAKLRVFRVAVAAASLLTLALVGQASSYAPAPAAAWVVSGGTVGGSVETIAVSGTTAYVGGDFGYIGPETGSFVAMDGSSGALSSPWPVVGGNVSAVASDGSGGWFIGGSFASIGTRHAANVAHIRADGTLDTSFAASTDGPVYALAASGSALFAGGGFTHAGGAAHAGLAAFDRSTGAVVGSFTAGVAGTNSLVSALALAGSTLYVGGLFDTLGGQPRHNIGSVSTSGAVTDWDPRTDDLVNTITLSPLGIVYVGGFFATVNASTTRHYAAAFDPASGAATAWNPAPNAEVYAIRFIGSTVYLGGAFSSVAGQTRSGAAAVDDAAGTTPTAWNPKITGSVYQLAVSGSSIYAAGSFQTVNDTTSRDNVGLFNATTGAPVGGFAPVVGGDVFALAVDGSTVVAGGYFRAVGSGDPIRFRRDNLGALDLGTGQSTPWDPDTNDVVFALAVSGSTVYAGGGFTRVNGTVTRNALAAFGTTDPGALPWNPNLNGNVFALTVLGSTVYAGGDFTLAQGLTRNRVAAFAAGGAGTALAIWNPSANGPVYSLDAWNNTVYLGGDFTTVTGLTRTRLAAVDTTGTLRSWNPGANDTVYAVTHSGSTEYAGGAFTTAGGLARKAAAAFDASTGVATPWDPHLELDGTNAAIVVGLAPTASTMYLGGVFRTVGDCAVSCPLSPGLAAVSLATGTPLTSWQPGANGTVNTLGIAPQGVVVGGRFSALGYPPAGAPFNADEPGAAYRGGLAVLRGLPDAPSATATAGDQTVSVSLTPPQLDGGAAIQTYTVTASPGGAQLSGASGPFVFNGLTNGVTYTFSATATTSVGTGPAGVATAKPRTIPGAPTSVIATPGDTEAKVSFATPASDGGDTIASYTVTSSPGNISASGASAPITVLGLHNGTSYTFTVTATNSAGPGPTSAPSAPVVPHEGGRPHDSAPDGLGRPAVPDVPTVTTPRPPPPHHV